MNNNRGNNRRRGRGNNNNRQQGGQNVNRIDSRARGNAPQLLEKYRKLAHDAHLNGDRVQEEYYLQFADHYFRVLADQRVRQEEARQPRQDRWQDGGDGSEREDGDYGSEYASDDYTAYDQPHRREREERQPRSEDRQSRGDDRQPRSDDRQSRGEERQPREDRSGQNDRPQRAERQAEARTEASDEDVGAEQSAEQRSAYEPPENPFVRENRGNRGLRPRREDRRPRRDSSESDGAAEAPAGFDASVLPPAISSPREERAEAPADEPEAKPRRARAPRRPRPPADDAGETLETVS